MTGTTKPLVLGPFTPGVNNRRPDFKLDNSKGGDRATFLRSAVNTDITEQGTVKRRAGYALALAGSDCHSLWTHPSGTFGFYVDYATLYRVTGSAAAPVKTALRTDMTPGRLVSYAEVNDSTYYSNGLVIGRIDAAGNHTLGVPMLAVTPLATASAGGTLRAGDYLVCFTQRNLDGEESGSTVPQPVTVPANGTVTITNLPAAFPAGVAAVSIYFTAANDGVLLRRATLTTAQSTFTLATTEPLGGRCPTLLLTPMPAGNIVRELNGRLLVAAGSMLYYSEPYAHALTNPARNYIPFPAPISMIESCQTGFFVAADQTYWVGGDVADTNLDPVLPFGAVPNTSGQSADENIAYWMSTRGMIRGTPDGQVVRLQEANVAVDTAPTGAFLYRKGDGMKQALGALFGANSTAVAASSWLEAEVIRKATSL